ncbi:hypothetical protein Emag_007584 [Eimeria magna]
MHSPPHTRSRTEREDVVDVEPPQSVASQQTVQQPTPAAALPAAAPSTPVAWKRQRTEPAEPRIVKFVVGTFRPSDLKDIKNAKKRLAKSQTQEALQHNEIIYVHRRLKAYKGARKKALDGLIAPRARHEEEESDEVVEARPALPTPAAPQSAPTSPAAPQPVGPSGQGPLPLLFPTTTSAVNALGNLAAQGWDNMTTRCVWWTLAAARQYRTARESFEYRLQELRWVDNMTRTVAAARSVLTSLPQGQRSLTGLADRMRQEQLGGPAVTEHQLSSEERLAALMGPGRASLREFLDRVYRTGQALLGSTVATFVPPRRVALPAAPHDPVAVARPAGPDSASALPGNRDVTRPPPPLPALLTEEFRLPEPCVAVRDPRQQLGMDGLLNGSAGRSPADDVSSAADDKGERSAEELSGVEQPAAKRARTQVTWFSSAEARRA